MKTPRRNFLEWSVFSVSLVIVAAVGAYLAYASTVSSTAPPRLEVQTGGVERVPGGFAVAVAVFNRGDTTAANVLVEVRAGEDTAAEQAEVTLAYVPRGSSRRAWVTFRNQPDPGRLSARVLGYEEP